ncbi:glycosyltransferase [Meiothermus sp. QL-1]|uniref:glycosyltransferase n=1 Tax=Meiothermus sp. QL-1 TaxID=2058095 RepID=UPI000E0A9638|nr:glycosyltransferase [Meiothermus sp. QL-1]RDI96141.1 glycosyltransferase [Meiothermus sp. QL-1]
MRTEVALLMPVYQDQAGLEFTLSSLPKEVPLDVVVVDDGSQPPIELPTLPSPHKGFLLRLSQNQGIEYALNHGLEWILSQGYPYVARLDAGDECLPGRFEKQLDFLKKHPEYAMVGGQVLFINEQGKEVFRERFPTEDSSIRRIMHARNCFIHPAVMIRSQVLKEVGLYSNRYKAVEDYELFFRVVRRYKVANLADTILAYRINPLGISLKKRRQQVWNRLRVMLLNFDPLLIESWLGILKNSLLLITPVWMVQALKRRLAAYRGWL